MLDKIKFKVSSVLPKSHRNKRMLVTILSLVISVLMVYSIFETTSTEKTTVSVVRATRFLEAGTRLDSNDLEIIKVGGLGLTDHSVKEKRDAIGKYLKSDLYPTDNLTMERLSDKKLEPFPGLKKSQKVMSFTVNSLAASVSNNIRIGDRIEVVYSEALLDPNGINTAANIITLDLLKGLKVVDIKDANGNSELEYESGSAKLYETTAFIPAAISVIVNDEQAAELYKAELSKSAYAIFMERDEK